MGSRELGEVLGRRSARRWAGRSGPRSGRRGEGRSQGWQREAATADLVSEGIFGAVEAQKAQCLVDAQARREVAVGVTVEGGKSLGDGGRWTVEGGRQFSGRSRFALGPQRQVSRQSVARAKPTAG